MKKSIKRSTKRSKESRMRVFSEVQDKSLTSSTSSSTTVSSTDYSLPSAEENERNLLSKLLEFSDESGSDIETEHQLFSMSFAEDLDYFDNFSSLPDITNISENVSIYSAAGPVVAEMSKKGLAKDAGAFVDPLTGLTEQEKHKPSAKDESSEPSSAEKSLIEGEISWVSLGSESSGDTIQGEEFKPAHDKDTEQDADHLFEILINVKERKSVTIEKIDSEDSEKEEQAKELRQQTVKFLHDIINAVVMKSELSGPDEFLRERLDNKQLISILSDKYCKYKEEQYINYFLNRKVIEYYRRRKMYRFFTEGVEKNAEQEKKRYYQILKELDSQLAKTRNVKNSYNQTAKKVTSELKMMETKTEDILKMLDTVVKKTLCRDDRPRLNDVVVSLLKRMAKIRAEISDVRYQMILKQHTHADLLAKHGHIQDLGEGLTVRVYDQLRHETQSLSKKIEERNTDLKKLHERMRNTLHLLAHYKEKQDILHRLIASRSTILDDLLDESKALHRHVYDLKLQRTDIRKQIKSLNLHESLLNKPALMYDYDRTMEIYHEKRAVVNYLRLTLRTIKQRIKKLEDCDERKTSFISTSMIV